MDLLYLYRFRIKSLSCMPENKKILIRIVIFSIFLLFFTVGYFLISMSVICN